MYKSEKEKINHLINVIENDNNRETIKRYVLIRKRVDKVKSSTISSDLTGLLALCRFLGEKSLKTVTQDDMLAFEEFLENEYQSNARGARKGVSRATILGYEASIKRFYKYIANPVQYRKGKQFQKNISYPDNVSWMTVSENRHHEYPLDKIMSEEELLRLIRAANNDRDKAIIAAALYDGGLRLSEMISLNVGSVEFDKLGAKFILPPKGKNQKTGPRVIRLFLVPSSQKYLKTYLNNHPFNNYDYAPLFYSFHHDKLARIRRIINKKTPTAIDFDNIRLSLDGYETRFRRIKRAAGLNKITPHVLRHNSATQCAKKGFNEMQLRIRFGWKPSSRMPSKYVHLASKDLDDKVKEIIGFVEPEEPEPSKLVPIACWNCEEENVPTNKFCSKCGAKLDRKPQDAFSAKDLGLEVQDLLKDEDLLVAMELVRMKRAIKNGEIDTTLLDKKDLEKFVENSQLSKKNEKGKS